MLNSRITPVEGINRTYIGRILRMLRQVLLPLNAIQTSQLTGNHKDTSLADQSNFDKTRDEHDNVDKRQRRGVSIDQRRPALASSSFHRPTVSCCRGILPSESQHFDLQSPHAAA